MFHWPGNRSKTCFDLFVSLPQNSWNPPLFYRTNNPGLPVFERDYVSAMLRELREAALSPAWACRTVRSIYFGLSAPGLVSGQSLRRMLFGICNFFPVDPSLEVTMEILPGAVTPSDLETLLRIGVNRIRVRGHSFNDPTLKMLGCSWGGQEVRQTIADARSAGFANVGVDLLFGVPEQTVDQFRSDLLTLIDSDIDSVTCAPVAIEPTSNLGLLLGRELKSLHRHAVNLDLERMYKTLVSALDCAAYGRTTLFQFAKAGSEPRFNLYQIDRFDLLGLGAQAMSRFTTLRRESIRRANIADPNEYVLASALEQSRIASSNSLSCADVVREHVACRLQHAAGLNLTHFKRIFGIDLDTTHPGLVDVMTENGLVERAGHHLCLTAKGAVCAQNVVRTILALDWEYPEQRKFKRSTLNFFSWRKERPAYAAQAIS